jgi:hypothetical protein
MPAPPDEWVIRMRVISTSPRGKGVGDRSVAMDLCDIEGHLQLSGRGVSRQCMAVQGQSVRLHLGD